MYKKRPGTSGICGHFYESKLLSLILFRAQHNDDIEEFYLASNMDEIGAFDDICFKAKIKGQSRPLIAFIQLKHKEKQNKILNLDGKHDLVKYFESYLAIKQKFNLNSKDKIFNEQFDDTESAFIIYTNAKGNVNKKAFGNSLASNLNGLIATGEIGTQPHYTDEQVHYLSKIYTATVLAKRFAKFLYNKNNRTMMNDNFILLYHVLLADNVVNVSEEQNGQRTCTFRHYFFDNTDEFVTMFRDELYREVIELHKLKDKTLQESYLLQFLSDPSEITLSRVIGSVVKHKNGKFKCIIDIPISLRGKLDQINFPQATVNEAIRLGATNILKSTKFTVPDTFGNMDIKLRGKREDINKRLNHLTYKIVDLINKSKPSYVIGIDESVGEGLLQLNGGLGSAAGNLLVYDYSTKLMKFTNNSTTLKTNARSLLQKLNSKIDDLHEYRFNIKYKKFPKLSFDCIDEGLARDFLSKLVFYTHQGNQNDVERTLKNEIEDYQCSNRKNYQRFFPNIAEAIFLKYHSKIQKWWMSPKEALTPYLTKSCGVYQEALNTIMENSQTQSIHLTYYTENIKTIEMYTQFSETNIELLKSLNILSGAILITSDTKLTIIRVLQCLKSQEHVVLDLHDVSSRSSDGEQFGILQTELNNISKDYIIIIVCENFQSWEYNPSMMEKFSKAVDEKIIIVITEITLVPMIKQYFPRLVQEFHDKKHSLADLCPESQEYIIKNARVVVQDKKMRLDSFLNCVPVTFIKGAVLNHVIHKTFIILGESVTDAKYDEIRGLYVDRTVRRGNMSIALRTLNDIEDNVVLITAESGMGKSTLLTHLSLKTQELDEKLWIVRINLLDHSMDFSKWQSNNILLDASEILKLICCSIRILLPADVPTMFVDKTSGEVHLQDFHGDDWSGFKLQIFLHFYNRGKVIFLFDGFDEICPHYADTVLTLLYVVKNNARKNKIWITSREYSEIQTLLQESFGAPFKLEKYTDQQLSTYLDTFWRTNLVITKSNDEIIERIKSFLDKTLSENVITTATLSRPLGKVHASFVSYLIRNFPQPGTTDRWSGLQRTINFLRRDPEVIGEASTVTVYHRHELEPPLLTHLVADCIVKRINRLDCDINVSFDLDVLTAYQGFIETILQKHFEYKRMVNIFNPEIVMLYNNELTKFMDVNKKLAAYVIFYHERYNIFNREELRNVQTMIDNIKLGREKTGLICSVSNDIPQFIHRTFAEYLAVEFLFDVMNTMSHERRKILVEILTNQIASLGVWINQKLSKDEYKELVIYFHEKEDVMIAFPSI